MNGEGLLLEKKVKEKLHVYRKYRKFGNWGQGDLSLDNRSPMILSTPRVRFDERGNKCYINFQKMRTNRQMNLFSLVSLRSITNINPCIWQAGLMGAKARRLLNEPTFAGEVLAALPTSIYLLGKNGEIIWVTLDGLPMHRRCLQASFQPGSLRAEQAFFIREASLRIGEGVAIELDRAREWEPPAIPEGKAESLTVVNARLRRLLSALPALGKGEGLGQAIPLISAIMAGDGVGTPMINSLIARASSTILGVGRAMLDQDITQVARIGKDLVGLGPGLTPSGDDFLGGMLFAAHSLKMTYPEDFYWEDGVVRDLIDWARTRTNPISHAVLHDLALGYGPGPLHEVVRSLLMGHDLECLMAAVARLLRIGHSSGWDILAGLLAGMLMVSGRMS
jgi:hypothetical protein